jgi:2-hydroxyacyl-CoA lyase 1
MRSKHQKITSNDLVKVGNASANHFPLLLLGGSVETHLVTKGAFQEMDFVNLFSSQTKISLRPSSVDVVPSMIAHAYRTAFYGRPGPAFVDLPADLINDPIDPEDIGDISESPTIPDPPKAAAEPKRLSQVASLLKSAQAPLIVIGKGAAYAQAEDSIRNFVDQTCIPFLPSPMGKGIVPDSHPLNASSARSAAMKTADVVLLLGVRLNWIMHYGEAPKWSAHVKFIQVDISPEEMGRNAADPNLSILGDVSVVITQLSHALGGWSYTPNPSYIKLLAQAKQKNWRISSLAAHNASIPLTYAHAFSTIKSALHTLSPPETGGICYVAEGANTMDISRSIFPVEHPRLRLDAGSFGTMGVGLPYAIAAWEAYNAPTTYSTPASCGRAPGKKIVAIEGDSAFGFSGMEMETMARLGMDVLIFVINNSGIYFGDSDSVEDFEAKRQKTKRGEIGLRSWALGFETRYERLAEACGGIGYFVRSPEELERATVEGFMAKVPVIVNVIIQSGKVEKPVSTCLLLPRPKLLTEIELWVASDTEEEGEGGEIVTRFRGQTSRHGALSRAQSMELHMSMIRYKYGPSGPKNAV